MPGYRIILAYVSDVGSAPATLDLALTVGRTHSAEVDVLHVRGEATAALPLVTDNMPGKMLEELLGIAERQARERADQLRRRFDEACRRIAIPVVEQPAEIGLAAARWCEARGDEEEVVITEGRVSDLIVMARLREGEEIPSPVTLNAALLDTGRPVLLAPPSVPAMVGRRVAIMWNGSPQAARAVASAMPLLVAAEYVKVLAATDDSLETSPGKLVHYLSRHEIAAEHRSFTAGGEIGPALLGEAEAMQADLIVLGAYTHSRLRQLVFGGVTKHILTHTPIPALLCR